jgi:hypothetical protein
MNRAYQALNICLDHLRKMEFDQMQKLRIEIQLIQVKRLMLCLEWDRGDDNPGNVEVMRFESEFLELCNSGVTTETTASLLSLVRKLVDRLSLIVKTAGKKQL